MLREVLRVQESVLGPEHPETLVSLYISTKLIEALGDPKDATARFKRVLAGRRRALGEDHPHTIDAAQSLANHLLFKLGQTGRGLDVSRIADLADRRRQVGTEHPTPEVIEQRNRDVRTLMAQGELVEAKELMDQLVSTSRDVLGDDDAVTLRVMTTFADLLFALGHPDGARQGHQLVLDTRRRVLGEHHPETQSSRARLAELGGPK
jgi:hypothetical protein